jgi:hypothetical protein
MTTLTAMLLTVTAFVLGLVARLALAACVALVVFALVYAVRAPVVLAGKAWHQLRA